MGMSDFLNRYGEQLKQARRRQRRRGLRGFAEMPGRRRSQHRFAALALGGVALLAAVLTIAFTRSTTVVKTTGTDVAAVPPENEALEHAAGGATPDELRDLKESSNATVTTEMVRRQQAQAADVPAAANGISWKQMGPYNIGGRVVDVTAD